MYNKISRLFIKSIGCCIIKNKYWFITKIHNRCICYCSWRVHLLELKWYLLLMWYQTSWYNNYPILKKVFYHPGASRLFKFSRWQRSGTKSNWLQLKWRQSYHSLRLRVYISSYIEKGVLNLKMWTLVKWVLKFSPFPAKCIFWYKSKLQFRSIRNKTIRIQDGSLLWVYHWFSKCSSRLNIVSKGS